VRFAIKCFFYWNKKDYVKGDWNGEKWGVGGGVFFCLSKKQDSSQQNKRFVYYGSYQIVQLHHLVSPTIITQIMERWEKNQWFNSN